MAIDLTKPVFILAAAQGDRLAVMGGSNDEHEARTLSAILPNVHLLVAVPADTWDLLNKGLADIRRDIDTTRDAMAEARKIIGSVDT